MTVVDFNNPGAIPFGDEVTSVTGTTVTLSLGVTSAIGNGDTIAFYNNLTEDDTIWGQIAVLGAAILSLSSGFGFTALQEANAILAAVGSNTADLNPDYGIALLASFAGSSTSPANMEAVGEAVAGLVTADMVSPFAAAADLYNSFTVLSVVTPGQLVNISVGLLSGGSAATAAQLIQNMLLPNVEPIGTIVSAFEAALGTPTNSVTALGIVDVAAEMLAAGASFANAAALVAPLIANNTLTGQAVVGELANFIGALPSPQAGEFISLVATIAATTGNNTAELISIGVGVGTAIANNQISSAAGFADLGQAINGVFAGSTLTTPPIITLDQGLAILVGVGAGPSAIAAGETIAGLVVGSAPNTQTAISDIETALSGNTMTSAEALNLLAGMVVGGAQSAAGAAVATLYQAGQISQIDLGSLAGSAVAGNVSHSAAAYLIAAAYPSAPAGTIAQSLIQNLAGLITNGKFPLQFNGEVITGQGEILGNGPDGVTLSQLGAPVSGPGVPNGATVGTILTGGAFILADGVLGTQTNFSGNFTITNNAAAVEAQIVAALPPSTQLSNLIQVLVGLGTTASPSALGQTLYSIIESGAASTSAVVAAIQATGATGGGTYTTAPLFALGSLAQMAALQPSGSYAVDPAVIQSDVYNAIVAMFPPSADSPTETAAQFVTQYIGGQLVQQGGIFKTIFLPVLVQLAVRDPNDYVIGSGTEFNTLLGNGAVSASDLAGALSASGVTGGAALVVLAGAIDISAAGSVLINQDVIVENQLLVAFQETIFGQVSETALQSYATALQTAAGLPAQNAVGGLALLFTAVTAVDGGGVSLGGIAEAELPSIAAPIASLVSGNQITEANAYTIIGQTYQATGFTVASLPSLMGLVGYALGDTPAAFVFAVGAGSYGGHDATVGMLVRLTGIDGQATGVFSSSSASDFPNIGLAVGAELAALATFGGYSLSQILTDILAIPFNQGNLSIAGADPGVSDDNKALVLFGMAAADGPPQAVLGGDAQVVAIGAALGTLLNSGAQPAIAQLRGVITYDQWVLLLAGAVTTANANTAAAISTQFDFLLQPALVLSEPQEFTSADLPVPTGVLTVAQLITDLDQTVREGQLSAAAAVETLEVFAAGIFGNATPDGSDTLTFPGGSAFPVGAMAAEVVALINAGQITASAAVAALVARAGNGSAAMQAVAGGIIGILEASGAASDTVIQAAIDAAVAGNTLTGVQAAVIDGAAAIAGSSNLAATLGADLGTMINAGDVSLADAVNGIGSGASTYAFSYTQLSINIELTNAVVVLLGVASTATVTGAQIAVGEAIGGLVNQNDVRTAAEAVAAIGNATGNATGDLTPAQAIQVLIGVAATAGATVPVGGLLTEVAVGGEFDTLIGAGNADHIRRHRRGLGQAIQAGTLSATIGIGVLVEMAAQNGSMTDAVTAEIAALINGHVVTAAQALAALFATAGFQDFTRPVPWLNRRDDRADHHRRLLESQTSITPAEVNQAIIAATTGGSIAADHAINILLALSADAPTPAAGQAALDTLAGLLSNGIGNSALSTSILAELNAGILTCRHIGLDPGRDRRVFRRRVPRGGHHGRHDARPVHQPDCGLATGRSW